MKKSWFLHASLPMVKKKGGGGLANPGACWTYTCSSTYTISGSHIITKKYQLCEK